MLLIDAAIERRLGLCPPSEMKTPRASSDSASLAEHRRYSGDEALTVLYDLRGDRRIRPIRAWPLSSSGFGDSDSDLDSDGDPKEVSRDTRHVTRCDPWTQSQRSRAPTVRPDITVLPVACVPFGLFQPAQAVVNLPGFGGLELACFATGYSPTVSWKPVIPFNVTLGISGSRDSIIDPTMSLGMLRGDVPAFVCGLLL